MTLDRRQAIKALAGAGAAAAATPAIAHARPRKQPPVDAVGLLYDATKCVGCKACVTACKNEGGLALERAGALWDAAPGLTAKNRTVIKNYEEQGLQSFMKAQCMHCIDPACASACMLGALQKREYGIVTWDGDLCVGCRYCQIACPYNVPRFEWDSATPEIVKCELCADRIAEGKEPACSEVCPREAIVFGKRDDLLAEAKRRIAAQPELYEPRVFGEHDGGGTQVLYLSKAGIGFDALGLPNLGDAATAALPESVQHFIYKGFAAPVALYAAFAAVVWRNRRAQTLSDVEQEEV